MSHPLISIVVCSYNGERFIKEQVDSILNQTYPNIEIIISDDASQDATPRMLNDYKQDQRIKLFFQSKNIGSAKNFEFVARNATGAFIAFSDQDDAWLPQKLERLYSAIGDGSLVYCDSELIDEYGNKLNKKISDLRNMYSGHQATGFVFSNVVWGHALMINSKILPSVLPIPAGIPHDIWTAFIATTITGIKYLDEPLTLYRQHASTATKTIAEKTRPREMSKRFADFEKQLNWIGVMKDHERPGQKEFYDELYKLYETKRNGKYSWSLFSFLMKHRKKLFMFTKKRWSSQLVEIFKQAKAVKSARSF
jgi:glycosyltransferase involved in cell wall biosynthesis